MGLGAVIYRDVPSFIKIGSGVQKLIGGIYTHGQQRDLRSLLYIFQNKESRPKLGKIFSTLGSM
jgi:hypothetical protein